MMTEAQEAAIQCAKEVRAVFERFAAKKPTPWLDLSTKEQIARTLLNCYDALLELSK